MPGAPSSDALVHSLRLSAFSKESVPKLGSKWEFTDSCVSSKDVVRTTQLPGFVCFNQFMDFKLRYGGGPATDLQNELFFLAAQRVG